MVKSMPKKYYFAIAMNCDFPPHNYHTYNRDFNNFGANIRFGPNIDPTGHITPVGLGIYMKKSDMKTLPGISVDDGIELESSIKAAKRMKQGLEKGLTQQI